MLLTQALISAQNFSETPLRDFYSTRAIFVCPDYAWLTVDPVSIEGVLPVNLLSDTSK